MVSRRCSVFRADWETWRILVRGDLNTRDLKWAMPQPDSRGKWIQEMTARNEHVVLNTGSIPDDPLCREGEHREFRRNFWNRQSCTGGHIGSGSLVHGKPSMDW